ncbi:FecR family protein [Oceanobacter mangrovi]|uniref:FecR family protein n=1 Tax=Oceanobacter mangrovi TaxID=2862510 RepID=UPI001C8EAAF7|nr:FecR domain-containing protein [Oceanobacter mangrovi]
MQAMISDELLEQASDWYDRLDELDTHELKAYHQWLQADEQHRAAAAYIARYFVAEEPLLADAAMTLGEPEMAAQRDEEERTVAAQAAVSGWRNWFNPAAWAFKPAAVMALLVFVVMLPLLWWQGVATEPAVKLQQFATATGERQQLKLDDGSQVVLNAASQLSVALSDQQRLVNLPQGEAFFSVARDVERPFVVDTGIGQVRVLGTAFNVDRSGDGLVVTVEHGVVEVSARGVKYRLFAGDGLRLQGSEIQRFNEADAGNWRTGWRQVNKEPLTDLISHLRSYTDKTITADGLDDGLVFSGRYSPDDVEGTLALVGDLFGLQLSVTASEIRLAAPQ